MTHPFPDRPESPRIYTVPGGLPFARTFADGLRDRLRPLPPEVAARTQVFVSGSEPSFLLQRTFGNCFGTGFLPSAHSIRGIESDPAIALPAPPVVDYRDRLLVLARLVAAYLASQGDPAGMREAVVLAGRLGALLDELHTEGIQPEALLSAAPEELASHWENASRFLALIGDTWPALLRARGLEDSARCRALAVDLLLRHWERHPPRYPVLVAGSTATDATARRFAVAVAGLPLGAVVLPGLDLDLDDSAWDAVDDPLDPSPGHPQYAMRRLLDSIGVDRQAVLPWSEEASPVPERTRFLGQALRPAPVTEAWRRDAEDFDAIAEEAMRGVELIEAASADEEASAVALVLREAAETPDLRAVFVTEDVSLRQRVLAKCERWRFRPADRRGTGLAMTPYGRFAIQAARVALTPPDSAALLGLIKDPHCRTGRPRERHERCAARVERILRAETARLPGLAGLREAVREWGVARPDRAVECRELLEWMQALESDWSPLTTLSDRETVGFGELLNAHLQTLDRLEAAPVASPGRAAIRDEFEALWVSSSSLGEIRPGEYPGLVAELLFQSAGGLVEPGGHPRVTVESTLTARLDLADLVVFGGLNEDAAPGGRGEDPWLNRSMREALGLPPPERRIGTLAHDAAELFAAGRVVLSRAARTAGETRVASRWLLRLINLLQGTGPQGEAALCAMRKRGQRRLRLARALERPAGPPIPAPRPDPRPPVAARPRRMSATAVERLLKDPYAVYAERILGLRPLEPLGAEPDPRLRGTFVHRVLARYLRNLDPSAKEPPLRKRLQDALSAEASALSAEAWTAHWPWQLDLWTERVRDSAHWLADADRKRMRGGWRPAALEVSGSIRLDAPGGPIEVHARADRIDVRDDPKRPLGALFDYKAGQPPHGKNDIGQYFWKEDLTDHGWAWQLGICALIAEEGGFEGLPRLRVEGAEYVGVSGGTPGEGKVQSAFEGEEDVDPQSVRWALTSLFAAYDRADMPYAAWRLPAARVSRWSHPYDQLSRFQEWSATGADSEDAGDG